MKKNLLTLAMILACFCSYSQNTFPASGNTGIGTTAPVALLHINGANDGGIVNNLALGNAGTSNGSQTAIYMGFQAAGLGLYGARILQTGQPSYARSGDLSFQIHNITASNADAAWDTPLFIQRITGNVGIGTTTPNEMLNVNGNVSVGANYGNALPTSLGAGSTKLLYVFPTATGLASAAGSTTYYLDNLTVQAQSQSGTWYPTTGTISSVLKGGNLNLAAGNINETGNDGSRLATYTGGDINFYPGYAKNGTATANNPQLNYGNIIFYTPTGASRTDASFAEFMRIDGGGFYSTASTRMAPRLIIGGGNVGIGTGSPDQKLTVKGTVHATAVVVDLNVLPDYVFEKDYPLLSLNDVKTYVEKNHHLPDVPSAATVKKKGLDLGEMNKVLLQKVEELTLYLIEKDKEIKELQQQKGIIQSQQKQIDELRKTMDKLSQK